MRQLTYDLKRGSLGTRRGYRVSSRWVGRQSGCQDACDWASKPSLRTTETVKPS